MASKRKPPRVYYREDSEKWACDIRIHGERFRRTLKATTEKQAIAEARALRDELAASVPTIGRGYPLSQAIAEVIEKKENPQTRSFYVKVSRALFRAFPANCDVFSITEEHRDLYVAHRKGQGIKGTTIGHELTLLRQALSSVSPVLVANWPRYKANAKPRKHYLQPDQARALLAVASDNARVWLMLALYASAEPAAIRRTEWGCVDFDAGILHVRGTKRGKRDRFVPMPVPLADFIASRDRSKPLVPGWANMYRDLRKWCERAEIPHTTLTDLRRTYASWLVQRGETNTTIAELLGHSSPAMIDRVYGQHNMTALRAAVAKLPKVG